VLEGKLDQVASGLEGGVLAKDSEVFERQLRVGAEGGTYRSKKAYEQGGHGWIMHEGW
jgi:hypothetical protein